MVVGKQQSAIAWYENGRASSGLCPCPRWSMPITVRVATNTLR